MKAFAMLAPISLAVLPLTATPASASFNPAADAYYESCLHEFLSRQMGTTNDAVAFCYPRAYGSETSGDGDPNNPKLPKGGYRCYGGGLGCDTP